MKFIDKSITGVFLFVNNNFWAWEQRGYAHEMPEVNISENIEYRNIVRDTEWTLIYKHLRAFDWL